jgi:hypothetical protein
MWVGYAEMAAAVSNAGGLGILVYNPQNCLFLPRSDWFDSAVPRRFEKRVCVPSTTSN